MPDGCQQREPGRSCGDPRRTAALQGPPALAQFLFGGLQGPGSGDSCSQGMGWLEPAVCPSFHSWHVPMMPWRAFLGTAGQQAEPAGLSPAEHRLGERNAPLALLTFSSAALPTALCCRQPTGLWRLASPGGRLHHGPPAQ